MREHCQQKKEATHQIESRMANMHALSIRRFLSL